MLVKKQGSFPKGSQTLGCEAYKGGKIRDAKTKMNLLCNIVLLQVLDQCFVLFFNLRGQPVSQQNLLRVEKIQSNMVASQQKSV